MTDSPNTDAFRYMTARERIEFKDSDTDDARGFLKSRTGVDPEDFEEAGEFRMAAADADGSDEGPASDPDELAESAMTFEDRREFEASDEQSPCAFLEAKYGDDPSPRDFSDPTRYLIARAVTEDG